MSSTIPIKTKSIVIDLNIGDQLTTISCGHIVVELIKFIAYQRLQIPYTYQWLKQVVNKRKLCEDVDRKESLLSERHFRIASMAVENLDLITKSLLKEISGASIPEEVCILLGGTTMTCREVYRLLLPIVCHKPQCHSSHIATDQKIQQSVFKALVTSDQLSKVFFNPLLPTNTYVFIKKSNAKQDIEPICDSFIESSGCRIPRSSKIVVIDFRARNQANLSCCNNFQVFGDVISQDLVKLQLSDSMDAEEFSEIESTDTMKWYQSSYVMTGFKDCVVNGTSVTNAWMNS